MSHLILYTVTMILDTVNMILDTVNMILDTVYMILDTVYMILGTYISKFIVEGVMNCQQQSYEKDPIKMDQQ